MELDARLSNGNKSSIDHGILLQFELDIEGGVGLLMMPSGVLNIMINPISRADYDRVVHLVASFCTERSLDSELHYFEDTRSAQLAIYPDGVLGSSD